MASTQWRPRNPEQPVARTSAVTVELSTIVEIHLTPRPNPGRDPGTDWSACLQEPIEIPAGYTRRIDFLATFYHGVYPVPVLPKQMRPSGPPIAPGSGPKRQAEAKLSRICPWRPRAAGSTRVRAGLGRSDRLW